MLSQSRTERRHSVGSVSPYEFGPSPFEDPEAPVVLIRILRKWNPRPACGTAIKSVRISISVCVCVQPWTKGLSPPLFPLYTGRGVWHSRPTTRNEAVGGSGKQGLISPAYLLNF